MWTIDPNTGQLIWLPPPSDNPPSGTGEGGACISIWLHPGVAGQPGSKCFTACGDPPPFPGSIYIGDTTFPPDPSVWGVIDGCQGSGETTPPTGEPPPDTTPPPTPIGSPPTDQCYVDPLTGQVICTPPTPPTDTTCPTTCCETQPKDRWNRYQRPDGSCYCIPAGNPPYNQDDKFIQTYEDGSQCSIDAETCNNQTTSEPPTEPEPPPEPDDPAEPPAIGGRLVNKPIEFCERFLLWKEEVITFGSQLIDPLHVQNCWFGIKLDLVSFLYGGFGFDILADPAVANNLDWWRGLIKQYALESDQLLVQGLSNFFQTDFICSVMNFWWSSVGDYLGFDRARVESLMAVRSLLLYLGSISMDMSADRSQATDDSLARKRTNETESKKGFLGGLFGIALKDSAEATASVHLPGTNKDVLKANLPLPVAYFVELIDRAINTEAQTKIPSLNEAIELWIQNQINDGQFKCLVIMNGGQFEFYLGIAKARRLKLHPKEAIEYFRRNTDKPDEVSKQVQAYLRLIGFTDSKEAEAVEFLYDRLPTLERFIHYLQRSVYDLQYVKDFSLGKFFDTDAEVQKMLDFIGRDLQGNQQDPNFWKTFGKDLRRTGVRKETAFLEYASSWILPAPEQLADMLIRLRPDRVEQLLNEEFGVGRAQWNADQQGQYDSIVFSRERYLRSLQEKHIAPYFRPKFDFLSTHAIPIRQLRQVYNANGIDQAELKAQLLDNHFSERSANFLVKGFELERRRTRASQGHGLTIKDAVSQYAEGLLAEQDARDVYTFFGFTKDEATAGLAQAKKQFKYSLLKQRLTAIEKCYISGRLSRDEAGQLVGKTGIDNDVSKQYLDLWDTIKACSQHLPTAQQLVKEYKDGTIDEGELATILARLNYSADTIGTILANAEFDITTAEYKAELKVVKEQEQLAERLAKELERQIRSQQRRKKESDTLQLNLDKAYARADLIELLPSLPDATSKAEARASEVRDVATESFDVGSSDL